MTDPNEETPMNDGGEIVDPAAKTQPAEGGRDEVDDEGGAGAEGGDPSAPIHEA